MNHKQQAGADFDVEIAGRVMQWRLEEDGFWIAPDGAYSGWKDPARVDPSKGEKPWQPSRDIAAAWVVVYRLQALFSATFDLAWSGPSRPEPWIATFQSSLYGSEVKASGDTAPLAICRAAIAVVEESE